MAKTKYRLRNWGQYNRALKDRYRLTIAVTEDVSAGWKAKPSGKRGKPRQYSDLAIGFALTIRELFRLPLRGCEGVLLTILEPFGLAVPDYTTLCRRARGLFIHLRKPERGENIVLAVDSSGLKLYGEGEWKVRMHGEGKRRTWRKLHIGVDVKSGEIISGVLTGADVHDCKVLSDLIPGGQGVLQTVAGDMAYDTRDNYEVITATGAKALIPPRRSAKIWCHGNRHGPPHTRDQTLRYIRKYGRKKWKKENGYHMRSLAETTFFRFKTIFSDRLRSRRPDNQRTESFLRLTLLNKMTASGMPDSYAVAV